MTTVTAGAPGSIRATCLDEVTVVRLCGEIDQGLRPEASSALSVSLRRGVAVVLDAADVTSIDAGGLSFVIQCGRIGHEHGLTVTLATCSPCVHDMLELAGAHELFDDDHDQGTTDLRSSGSGAEGVDRGHSPRGGHHV